MRLISVELEGYRRFRHRTKILFDGKLTALVGPNEAGKSTILGALERLKDGAPISARDRTRGAKVADGMIAIEALWLVEPEDVGAIVVPRDSEPPRWLIIKKAFGGDLHFDLIPQLRRDRRPRRSLLKRLEGIQTKPWFAALDAKSESEFELSELDQLIDGLKSDSGTVAKRTIERLADIADQVDAAAEDAPRYAKQIPAELRAVADHEGQDHPTDVAKRRLRNRTPDFLNFVLADRRLDSTYDLNDVIANPRRALTNLSTLAGLDLVALRDAIAADDHGLAVEIRDRANAELKRRLDEAWDQGTVEPRFETDDYALRILVRTGEGGLQDIAQRSDGLRAFIALVAFTTERARERPAILLIDEAEIHLHYDAQADLVQMLGHQRQAGQVIYTTHSAGCLPQDLGTGVRIVIPNEDQDRSSVDNWPWEAEGGFGPLLLGMGASTLAFVPTRGAVVGEGAFEVVMLPTLMREALEVETLDYQVAPGAAEASRAAAAHIDFQGQRVVWLVDGDDGGRKNRGHLQRSRIPAERIVTLGGADSGLALEDLVDSAVFLAGVNAALRRSGGDKAAALRLGDVPSAGRWTAVKRWCGRRRVSVPNKGAVAHRIVDQRIERTLLAPEHAWLLRDLNRQFEEIFAPE